MCVYDQILNIVGVLKIKGNYAPGFQLWAVEREFEQDIKSADPITKAHAILYVIYYVRCNMVHGEKHQDDHQRLLVSVVTRIFRIVKDQLHALLENA